VTSYVVTTWQQHFGRFRDHPAVELAAKLRRTRGVSFDACMSMAVHLSDAVDAPKAKVPFDPLPENLRRAVGHRGAGRLLEQTRLFVEETSFREFIQGASPVVRAGRVANARGARQNAHLEWFDDFFGRRPKATFKFCWECSNGGSSYGSRCRTPTANEELYCILGVWKTDGEGMPRFEPEMLVTVVHEFCHSYTNAVVDRHAAELEAAGKKIFPSVEAAMRRQGYGNWKTMMYESMVRACVIR